MNIMTWRRMLLIMCFVIGAQPHWAGSASADPVLAERDWGSDRFIGGCPVSVVRPVAGDLIAAGCYVEVTAEVAGDLVIVGGNLRLAAPVRQGLYAAGGRVFVDGAVQKNARIAGGRVELGPDAIIAGNASVGGGEVHIDGAIGGNLQVAAGRVRLNGAVGGDVEIGAGAVELGPNARIEGKLSYASGDEIRSDSAAQVRGGVERCKRRQASHHWRERARHSLGWAWFLGLLVIAAILLRALPRLYGRVTETVRTRWALSLLIGFLALVCVPVAALIAAITVIGIPLALLMIVFYLALLLIGYISTGIAVGDMALQHWQPGRAANTGWRIVAVALAMMVLSLLGSAPFVGGVVTLAALLIGIGALLMQFRSGPAELVAPEV